jgi:hypothetical protein
MQQSVNTSISDKIHKGNSDFDIARWYSHRNVNKGNNKITELRTILQRDVRAVNNNASASALYSSSETKIFTNTTASPFAKQANTYIQIHLKE